MGSFNRGTFKKKKLKEKEKSCCSRLGKEGEEVLKIGEIAGNF